MIRLPTELAEEIAAQIDNEGFDYWLRDGGWAVEQLKNYPELVQLANQAKAAMNKFEDALEEAGVEQP